MRSDFKITLLGDLSAFRRMMEKRKTAGLLTLQYALRTAPLGAPGTLPLLPPRDPFRVAVRLDAACWERAHGGCARRRPRPPPPLRGALEPAFLRLRNERERQRVRCVNEGYARLRDHLPPELAARRLSKVETLRAAVSYIKHLQELLERHARGHEGPAGSQRRAECNSDGESKASSAPSPCSEPEEGAA